ncbi:MAG: hypothetical protein AAF351_15510, partial [Pseudomonadota bacterium]
QAVEHSLTPKGLMWRMQASRAGIPFGEFILQKNLLYRIEQAYLISRENGLLIEHVHHEASRIKDSDAVSAMFTAIQDFVKESFSPDRSGRLESADMGEFTLWAMHGPHALLVCVIRGVPPKSLRGQLSAVLERIHFRYNASIKDYRGDTSTVPGVAAELERCLRYQAVQDEPETRRSLIGIPIVLLLALLGVLGYFLYGAWQSRQLADAFETSLKSEPGYYVSEVSTHNDRLVVTGLKDPLAVPVAEIAAQHDITADRLDLELGPYQSLDPEILGRRIDSLFATQPNLRYVLNGTALTLSGTTSPEWIDNNLSLLRALPGIESVDHSGVNAGTTLGTPAIDAVAVEAERLDGSRISFSSGTTLAEGQTAAIEQLAQRLTALRDLANEDSRSIQVRLQGSTDASGSTDTNRVLAQARAQVVAQELARYGMSIDAIIEAGRVPSGGETDLQQRFVVLRVAATPVASSE